MASTEKNAENICPVRYEHKYARHLIDIKVSDILEEPERMAVFRQLKIGSRLILFRDAHPREPQAVRIARSQHEPLAYLEPEYAALTAPLLEENNYLYAVVSRIFRKKAGFTAKVYVPEPVIPEKLSGVVFQREDCSCCFPRFETYTISVKEKKLVFEEATPHETLFRFELFYTPGEWRVVQQVLEITNFLSWEKSYDEIDENYDRWSVTVKYGKNKVFRSTGARIHPEEMNVFLTYMDNCLYIRNKKGRGTFITCGENKSSRCM